LIEDISIADPKHLKSLLLPKEEEAIDVFVVSRGESFERRYCCDRPLTPALSPRRGSQWFAAQRLSR